MLYNKSAVRFLVPERFPSYSFFFFNSNLNFQQCLLLTLTLPALICLFNVALVLELVLPFAEIPYLIQKSAVNGANVVVEMLRNN